jgi:hypothetical protein
VPLRRRQYCLPPATAFPASPSPAKPSNGYVVVPSRSPPPFPCYPSLPFAGLEPRPSLLRSAMAEGPVREDLTLSKGLNERFWVFFFSNVLNFENS